jgi:galactose oxidase
MLRKLVAIALSWLLGTSCFLSPSTANAQASLTGQWTRLQDFPVIPIDSHLLPSGKVMMWGRPGNQGYLWDPTTQAITALPDVGYDVFCAGHAFLADGRLLAGISWTTSDLRTPECTTRRRMPGRGRPT